MKKIIDSRGKLFGKVSIIDLAVVIIIAVLALSTGVKYNKTEKHMRADKRIEYTVKIRAVRQPTVDAFRSQLENLEDAETNKALGDICDIKAEKAKDAVALTDGTIKEVELENSYDLFLTISVPGTETQNNYYTQSGKKLVVGDSLVISNSIAHSTGMITGIKVVEE